MPVLAEYNPRPHRPARAVHLLGQLAGLVVAGLLLWLHGGFDRGWAGSSLDVFFPATLSCWGVCLVLMVAWVPRRFAETPGLAVLVPLAPALVGLGASVLMAGQVPRAQDPRAGCDLLVMSSFLAERVRAAGMLASGSMLLGACAPLVVWSEPSRRPRWPLLVAAAGVVVSMAWLFSDAALPSRAGIGGPAVRGLWVAAAAVGAWWIWACDLPLRPGRAGPARPVAATVASVCGLLGLGCAMVGVHRAAALHAVAYLEPPPAGMSVSTGVVAATAMLRCAPLLVLALLATAGLGLRHQGRRVGRGAVATAVVLAALGALAAGYEAGWRAGWDRRCGPLLPDDLQLPGVPVATREPAPGSAPVLVIGREQPSAKADPDRIPPAGGRDGRLLLAADRRLAVGRLEAVLRAAGRAGWHRFGLLVHPVGRGRLGQERLYGVFLDQHPARLRHVPFAITRFGRRMGPPPGVVANLVVESDRMEITFGGFGVEAEVLASLGRVLPDRHGRRDLAGLLEVLTEAKRRFPASTTLLILPHPSLEVAAVARLLSAVGAAGTAPPFARVRLAPLVR